MKKLIILAVLVGALPVSMMAQDDLYFTPKKNVKKVTSSYEQIDDRTVYHSGSKRDVDAYNRRGKFGSYYQKIGTDSLGNDIIEFHSGKEEFSDTLALYPGTTIQYDDEDDYQYSRRMSRFEDFYWYDPWMYGYYGFGPYWRSSYYDWYDIWYDPWYFGWYGWHYPYRYNWYGGWLYPRYYGWYGWGAPSHYVSYRGGVTGSRNHGYVSARGSRTATGNRSNFGGYRGNGQTTRAYDNSQARNSRFGGARSSSSRSTTYTPSRSSNSSPTYSNGGSFGGARSSSSGGSFGGGGGSTRSSGGGGGGHFGGRR